MNEILAQPLPKEAWTQSLTRRHSRSGLEACLLDISERLGRPLSPSDLQAAESGVKEAFDVPDAVRALEAAGLSTWFGEAPLSELDTAVLPAIAFLENNRALVVVDRIEDGAFVVYDPALGHDLTERSPAELARSYAGYVLVLRRRVSEDDPTSRTDTEGHWFWSSLRANRWTFSQVILAACLTNLLGLATSIFTMVVYDRILPNEALESLVALTIGMGIALGFDFLIKSLRASFIDRAGQRADREIGLRIFEHLLNLPLSARQGSTGALSGTLREFETVREFFTSATLIVLVDLPFIFLYVYVIYLVGGPLMLVPALAIPAVLIVGLLVQPSLAALAERNLKAGQSKQSVLVETVAGLETVKSVGASRMLRARWDQAVNSHSDHGLRSRGITQFALNATAFIQQSAQVLIVFYGVFLIQAGTISMGALIASVILTGRALGPLAQLAQTMTRLNQVHSSYKSLDLLMSQPSERPFGRQWLQRDTLLGALEFDKVTFEYPDAETSALRECSFKIKAGERVAVLGKIGSGKSTIARLLLGLYMPSQGAVRIDGSDVRQIDPIQLRGALGTVLQDVWLFSGSIRENIAIGAPRPNDAEVLEAAKLAGVDEFVRHLPDGYDTRLLERGEGLSGGQRQAICLARALVGNPPVLVLDEPTSAMDVRTEEALIERLKPAFEGRTVVIITHRPSLLALVERVLVIEGGAVVADEPRDNVTARAVRRGQS